MSNPLQIAFVGEGPTDGIVVGAALAAILPERRFVIKQLQPEGSLAFGELGAGWAGVYRWCRQSAGRGGGRVSGDGLVFATFDLLLLHLDADVAHATYAAGNIVPDANALPLPCEAACPPATATTNALRSVLLSWCGENAVPAQTVLCTPSKSTEAWVVAALFPKDAGIVQHGECLPDPEARLGQQAKRVRIHKTQADYRERAATITETWPVVAGGMTEAQRFQAEVQAAV